MKTTFTNGLDDEWAGCNALKVLYVSVITFHKFGANKIDNIILDYKDFKVITIFNKICKTINRYKTIRNENHMYITRFNKIFTTKLLKLSL